MNLTLNSSTGAITGTPTPTVNTTYSFTLRLTLNHRQQINFSITVTVEVLEEVSLTNNPGCHLQRQFTNASTNTKKYTISFWVTRSNHGVEHVLITPNNSVDDGASKRFYKIESDDHLRISINGGTKGTIITDRKFDDTVAWYHIVVQYDSTESAIY